MAEAQAARASAAERAKGDATGAGGGST
jgi:hypothetical protein